MRNQGRYIGNREVFRENVVLWICAREIKEQGEQEGYSKKKDLDLAR